MEVLRRLTLNKDGVRSNIKDRAHREHVRLGDVFERRDEGLVARELLVPPPIGRREFGANVHLINGRIELHPGKPLRKGGRIFSKELGKIGILEIAYPVRDAEMTKVYDRNNVQLLEAA